MKVKKPKTISKATQWRFVWKEIVGDDVYFWTWMKWEVVPDAYFHGFEDGYEPYWRTTERLKIGKNLVGLMTGLSKIFMILFSLAAPFLFLPHDAQGVALLAVVMWVVGLWISFKFIGWIEYFSLEGIEFKEDE